MTTYKLSFPINLEWQSIVALMRSLTARPKAAALTASSPIIFETVATNKSVDWLIRVPDAQRQLVTSRLRAHLPSVRVEQAQPAKIRPTGNRKAVELRLSTHSRPLKTDVATEVAASLLGAMADLRNGEDIAVQWFLGAPLPTKIAKPTRRPAGSGFAGRLFAPPALDAESARRRNEKQTEPVFGALGRIAVRASTAARRRQLIEGVLGALRQTSQPSVALCVRHMTDKTALRRLDNQVAPRLEWPCVLNAAEVATVVGWPVGAPVAAGVLYSGRKELPFSPEVLVRSHVLDRHQDRPLVGNKVRVLGKASYAGRPGVVALGATDALQHTHIIGPTGVGKSTLLANLAVADINAGRAVVVIEPKGDLIEDILNRIPTNRRDDVVLLDPADDKFPVGLSLTGGGTGNIEVGVDNVVHLFKTMFASSWGPRTQDVLHAALLTLAHTASMTLVELPLLLTNSRFRAKLVSKVNDPLTLGPFWDWFDTLSDGERSQVIAPVLNKVRAFTMRTSVRCIVGQSDPKFTMRDVFTKRRILLVPLRRGSVGPETANLLGGMVVAQLWQATQERSAIDPSRRHPVMVYLDEFQNYVRLPTGIGDVLAEARGLGLGLTLAHQNLAQLTSAELKSAVLVNARSRVVFQSSNQDAVALAKALGSGLGPEDITGLGAYEAYAKLMSRGASLSAGSMSTMPLTKTLGAAEIVRATSSRNYGIDVDVLNAQMLARRAIRDAPGSGGRRRRRP